jgi:voltage-gated potassium channel
VGLCYPGANCPKYGYGDVYPITVGGRVFTFFVLVMGLGVVAVPSGLLASALSKAREEE